MAKLREVKPARLFIIADGPRSEVLGEESLCEEARQVALAVDWECDVMTDFSSNNLGCKTRVITGLDWLFKEVESAIILEDDCLPDNSFFAYCDEMLTRFFDSPNVAMVSGNNYLFGLTRIRESYYASRYPRIWGWATWRRAWQNYDGEMSEWRQMNDPERDFWHRERGHSKGEARHWAKAFDSVARNEVDTWDFQWVFTMFNRKMVSLAPRINLVANIGIGADATHTRRLTLGATVPTGRLSFPLRHAATPLMRNIAADRIESRLFFDSSLYARIIRKILAETRGIFRLGGSKNQ